MTDIQQVLQIVKDAPLVAVFVAGIYLGRKWVIDQYEMIIDERIKNLEKQLDDIKDKLDNVHKDLTDINKTVSSFEGHLKATKEFKGGVI